MTLTRWFYQSKIPNSLSMHLQICKQIYKCWRWIMASDHAVRLYILWQKYMHTCYFTFRFWWAIAALALKKCWSQELSWERTEKHLIADHLQIVYEYPMKLESLVQKPNCYKASRSTCFLKPSKFRRSLRKTVTTSLFILKGYAVREVFFSK